MTAHSGSLHAHTPHPPQGLGFPHLAPSLACSVGVTLPAVSIPLEEPGEGPNHLLSGLADIKVDGCLTLDVATVVAPPLQGNRTTRRTAVSNAETSCFYVPY